MRHKPPMIFDSQDYRAFLKTTLVERIRKNASYSLRAFAAQIGVSASMLSEVLKGEKNLSVDKAALIASRLDLPGIEEQYFLTLVQLENASDIKQREKALDRLKQLAPHSAIRDLTIDHFHSIANWVCVASMALMTGHPQGLTAEQVATRLGVTKFEAEDALNHWVRLELLAFKSGVYSRVTQDHLMMKSKAPNDALRKFHRSMLEKASASLESQTNTEKFVGSETFAFDPEQLPEVAEAIEEATRKILKIAAQSKTRKEVYHLGFQFFRVTQTKKEKSKNEKQ